MTMFIQLVDGQPVGHAVTEENFRMLFPGTSFSSLSRLFQAESQT